MVQNKQPFRHMFTGVGELELFMEKASPRIKALLRKECSLMLQCRCCTNIFRHLNNFVLHKQKYCLNEYANVCKPDVRVVAKNDDAQDQSSYTYSEDFASPAKKQRAVPVVSARHQYSKPSVPLRRTNIVRYVMNKSSLCEANLAGNLDTTDITALPRFRRQVAVFPSSDGNTKCYIEAPLVSVKEPDPNEVLMVIPQDLSVQYRNMSLRRRVAQPIARKVSISEAECVNRMHMFVDVDPVECRCLAAECTEIRPFKDIFVLAYHVSMKHCHKIPPRNTLPCMMCAKHFITWETYYTHIVTKHDRIRKSHRLFRENDPKKRGRKTKGDDKNDRSMSPEVSGRRRDEQEAEAAKGATVEMNCCVAPEVASNAENQVPCAITVVDSNGRPLLEANDMAELHQNQAKTQTKLDRAIARLMGRSLHLNCTPASHKNASISLQTTRNERSTGRRSEFNVDKVLNTKMQRNKCAGGTQRASMEFEEHTPIVDQTSAPTVCNPLYGETTVDAGMESGNSCSRETTTCAEIPALPDIGDLITISDDSIDVDVGSNTVSETIDVVGDDVQTRKTDRSGWVEGAEPVSSDEWEGDSTKAYKSDVEDETAVDQSSLLATGSSSSFNLWPQDYDVLATTGENCSPVQSFYLCGDEDISPKSLTGDNTSVDNFSTTVAPKTSSSSECTDDCCSPATSYLSDQGEHQADDVDDDDVVILSCSADPPSEQIASDARLDQTENKPDVGQEEAQACSFPLDTGCTAQPYVVPTPMANFAPLSYQNYMMQSYAQEYESSSASDRTVAYGVAEQSVHSVNCETASQIPPNPYNQLYSSFVSGQQQSPSLWTLKRPRSLDAEMESQAHFAKRGVETAALASFPSAAGIPTNPFMNYLFTSQMVVNSTRAGYFQSPFLNYATTSQEAYLNNHLSQQFASKEVLETAEQKVESDVGPDFETGCEIEVVAEVEDTSAAPSPRTQRSQRARRLPARYRDGDYVCLLSDVEGSEELQKQKVKTACSSTSSPHASACAATSDTSNGSQAAEQNVCNRDLSSSHFNLAGTRWNAVFSLLEPLDSLQPKGPQYCGDCGCFCASLETGRRHVLSHIRLVRFVCKLCGVGGFFATDLRTHLMKGLCTGLSSILYGLFPVTNAMQADSLCEDADPDNPGGVVLFDGERQIVSSENMYVHKPDAQIELKILQRCM